MDPGPSFGMTPAQRRVAILNVVALTPALLAHMPRLTAWAAGKPITTIDPVLPAVTCTMQASFLTGCFPCQHGIVGNGWYFADEAEVRFWRQSHRLIQRENIWTRARRLDPNFTCANLFWWFNMYSGADFSVTPRPMYPADGRKIPDIYTHPAPLRQELQRELGRFPLFDFWGPKTSIRSSAWIAAAAQRIESDFHPTLSLIYLPHMDYCLQRDGTNAPQVAIEAKKIDDVVADLIRFYEDRGVAVQILSEYGIAPVSRPVYLNRVLRRFGLVTVRQELGRELLDPGASRAFAVVDHQIAHIYVRDATDIPAIRAMLEDLDGVERVYERPTAPGLNHPRAGDLIAIAKSDAWFPYYYWLDDRKAPDFARTVDIHRKPGYDPAELFLDPSKPLIKARILWRQVQKALGLRSLMDVIPVDARLVKGSHGRIDGAAAGKPLLIGGDGPLRHRLVATGVHREILRNVFGEGVRLR